MTNRHETIALSDAARAATTTAGTVAITQIRNATLWVDYAGLRFLIDPMLAEQGVYPGFEGTAHSELRNPLVPMPFPVEDVIQADAAIITHLHLDHWDDAAKAAVPKSMPLFVQNDEDAAVVRADGFTDVRVLGAAQDFKGVSLTKTKGQHGSDQVMAAIGDRLGNVCGVLFSHPNTQTIYLAGDTIWTDEVTQTVATTAPGIIILNAGDAQVPGLGPLIMGAEDVFATHKAAPGATIFATHMEAVNHCVLTRADLRAYAKGKGFAEQLQVPDDGETIVM